MPHVGECVGVCLNQRPFYLFLRQHRWALGMEHIPSKAANLDGKYFQSSTSARSKHTVMEISHLS